MRNLVLGLAGPGAASANGPGQGPFGFLGRDRDNGEGVNHFEIFGLPRRLRIDTAELQRRFYDLSRQHHPDFHHGAPAERQAAALLLVPGGVDFDAIDGASVRIIFGVVGPKRATGEHLRTLARISRLLRDEQTRAKLLDSKSPASAYELIQDHEAAAR